MRYSKKINIFFVLIAVIAIGGCYTQLMAPQEYIKIRRQQSSTPIANNTYSINYNQSCTSCHSVAELNERADELEYYGVRTVHNGVLLSSRQWLNENPNPGEILYGDPGPIYWPTPIYPTYPWWVPPVTIITNPTTPNKGNIIRTDGPTRDDKSDGGRERPIPAPTYTQPSVPVGGTSSTPVVTTPAPVVIITPSPTSTSQPTESGRTRDTNSNGATTTTKTRTEGSSRDSDESRPR